MIGEGRRTLPLATRSGPRATGGLRERLRLPGRCDRPRHGTLASPCHRGGLHVRGPGGEARRPRGGAAARRVRRHAVRLGRARRLAPSRRFRGRRLPTRFRRHRAADTSARAAIPPDLADRIQRLTLAEIVDLGLRNNPATRLAWANAQTAASAYGSERGEWYPIDRRRRETPRGSRRRRRQGRTPVQQSVLTPSVTLNYLLLRLRRPERADRGRAPAPHRRELHAQRGDPGRGAPDPGRLLPVSRQPRPAPGPAHHRGGGAAPT